MRFIISPFVFLFLCFGIFASPLFASAKGEATISISPSRGSYELQDTFSLTVRLNATEPVTSMKANVNYDSSRLRFLGINTTGSAFSYWWENGSLQAAPTGQVKLQASVPAPGITGTDLHVATIQFQATGNGLAAVLLASDALVLNSKDENVLNTFQSPGSIFAIGAMTIIPSTPPAVFSRNLQRGSQGADVKALQELLNSQGFVIASGGPGSAGLETDYFGPLTEAALMRYQDAYAAQILHPLGITAGTGYFGPSTRAYMNTLR